jgi:hypothetical protein
LPERAALGVVETRLGARCISNRAYGRARTAVVAGEAAGCCRIRNNSGGATIVGESRRRGNSNNAAKRLNTRDVLGDSGRGAIGQLLTWKCTR